MIDRKVMKRVVLSHLLVFSAIAAYGQGTVDFRISEFKESNDSLVIGCKVHIGSKAVEKSQYYHILPLVQAGDSIRTLPEIKILGCNKRKVLARFNKNELHCFIPREIKRDTTLCYDVRIPYELWMDTASIVLLHKLTGYRRKSTLTSYRLKDQVELSFREPYRVKPAVAYMVPAKEEKRRKRQGKAFLDFQVGRSVILPNYRRNPEELSKIDNAIRDVIGNPDVSLQGLYIEGYASPDGPYLTNERLSRERSEALKEYIRMKFGLDGSIFNVTSVAEDWDGLTELVKASDIPQKEKILEIISAVGIHEGRKTALMRVNKGIPYQLMLRDMFPELRRVEYQIDYTVKDYDLKQTLSLLERSPADLSQQELYNLAMSYDKGSNEFGKLMMETIPRYFPEDATANNNAACAMIAFGEPATARRYLEKAGKSGEVQNNMGVIYLLEGETDKAEACFMQAQGLGCAEASVNLTELQTKREDDKKQERYRNRK